MQRWHRNCLDVPARRVHPPRQDAPPGRGSVANRGRGIRYVANESNRITVRHPEVSDIVWPYWTHDVPVSAFASKLRRLIAVQGITRNLGGEVRYQSARRCMEPRVTGFADMVANGMIAIDFDARTDNGCGLCNHGTEFRIARGDLRHLYTHQQRFGA